MRKLLILPLLFASFFPALTLAEENKEEKYEVTVEAPRVAVEEAISTYSSPVSVLRFEPKVDLQSRNMAEAQGDVSIRGGIFENTGFKIGWSKSL